MRKRKSNFMKILVFLLLCIGIGYAALMTDLSINGVANVTHSSWDIHFDNLVVNQESTATVDQAANIDTATSISYEVTLSKPGDFYEFNVDVVNEGTIDAMIESVSSKLNNVEITTLPNYLEYSVTYEDDIAIAPNQLLEAGKSETYKVRIGYKKDINPEDLPSIDQTLNLLFTVTYVQADNSAVRVSRPSFADDDWDIVINTLKTGNIAPYKVGDEKDVDLGTFGVHKLRIANSTTPTECLTEEFSGTACGIVLEFVDIITTHVMNSTDTNVGGWPASSMRTYVNNDIYNALPAVIKNAIIDTTVVSGHGNTLGETNFTSTDKLYFLSTHEVWEDDDGNTNDGIDYRDTAYHNTRQLDYYKGLNVTTSNYSSAIKKNGTANSYWWLRSAYSSDAYIFFRVTGNGGWSNNLANNSHGVSPAFRIG